MTTKQFCPILMIGFEAPKHTSDPDPRTCKKDCAWFNDETKQCIMQSLNENLLELIDYTCAATFGRDTNDDDCF